MVNPAQSQQAKPAEPSVVAANQAAQSRLPFSDRQDFEDAMRGFIATTPDAANPDRYAFLKREAPPTVNPALWRQAQLNTVHGLLKVADGVYQVRGFSQANMTIAEGSTGLILIDTLSTPGAAREALALYFAHRPRKPVVAVIYSHSHGDHYGGASGVVSQADVAAGKTKIMAPAGFTEAVVGEAVIGGNAKARRAQYQFGGPLPLGERGNVDEGLGKNDSRGASGAGSIIAPNDTIQQPIETRSSITGKTAANAVTTVTTTRPVFESVILRQRTLADAVEHREITTVGDAKAVSDLLTLLVDFDTGFPVVEP
jgi:alkyl sulfatase BDS1-like metallo-beta-lactamase superfamily hydrolase